EGRLGRRRRLGDPQRTAEHRLRRRLGGVPPRRRRRNRELVARGTGQRRRRDGIRRPAARARAHERSGDRHRASCRRGLCGRDRGRPTARHPPADARGERLSTLLVGARQVVTCRGPARARRGREMAELEVLTDAAVLIDGERIAALGRYADLRPGTGNVERGVEVVEVAGVLFPGFVDCHTHAVFGAPRLDDHERRALGMDYKAIAAEGGGILESVRDVRARLAVACDVFCEPGVFNIAEARTLLSAARRYGLAVKLHADELEGSGGAELAVELAALSADHLAAVSATGVRALAASDTVAVLLPATLVFLGGHRQAPARRLLDAGA